MTYRISTYDPVDDFCSSFEWFVQATGLTLFALRPWIRKLRQRGYDDNCSILVEREMTET